MKLVRVKPRHRNAILSVLVVTNVIVAILVWQLNPHLAIPAVAALYGSYTLWTILFNERRMKRHEREKFMTPLRGPSLRATERSSETCTMTDMRGTRNEPGCPTAQTDP